MDHSVFIHSPTEGHRGCFQVWAIKNKTAINIYVQGFSVFVCLFVFVFLGPHPWHMEAPRLGVELELQLEPKPQPQQRQI